MMFLCSLVVAGACTAIITGEAIRFINQLALAIRTNHVFLQQKNDKKV
jgi:hypothetical protein